MRKTGSLEQALAKYTKGSAKARVGVLEDATYPDGTAVAQVAFWNEYGTSNMPARPFFRPTVLENKGLWLKKLIAVFKSTQDLDQSLRLVGEEMIGDFRLAIRDLSSPKNSDVTLLLKSRFPKNPEQITRADYYKAIQDVRDGVKPTGSNNNPLIWSGTMYQHGFSVEIEDA